MLSENRFHDWPTVQFEALVLIVARSVTVLTRLLDIASLLRTDERIQIVYTTDPGHPAMFHDGVDQFLAAIRARVIPWEQATTLHFHLIIAASENDRLHRLTGPILLVAHGFGYQKYYPDTQVVAGMNPERLIHDGRVVPTAIGLSHPEQRTHLAEVCPPAAARAVVIGDPAVDILLASRHRAPRYRRHLGASGRTLILLASTWGRHSLTGRFLHLPERLAAALPVDEFMIIATVHPGVESVHGRWQLDGWHLRAREAGVHWVAPDEWQTALTAADCVLSDEGSLALYTAVQDKPLLLVTDGADHTVPGSPLAALATKAPILDVDGDLRAQIDTVREGHRPGAWQDIIGHRVEPPGNSAALLRSQMYRLMPDGFDEPAEPAEFRPAEPPAGPAARPTALVIGAIEHDETMTLHRFPAVQGGEPHEALPYRHLLADLDRASVRQLNAAAILRIDDPRELAEQGRTLLANWPSASLIAVPTGPAGCLVRTRDTVLTARADGEPPAGFDPTVLASLVFVRLRQERALTGPDRLRIGNRTVLVSLR